MTTLSLHLVTWNGAAFLPELFASLRAQTFRDFEVIIVDNASTDDTVAQIEQQQKNISFPITLVRNVENKGFAIAQNQAWYLTKSPFVLVLNQDVILASDCIERLMNCIITQEEIASVGPLLLRFDGKTVDSLGICMLRNRRFIERDGGRTWLQIKNDYQQPFAVFGISGACVLLRRSAGDKVALLQGKIFDERYVMYKEDVDLAWRLAVAGFTSYTVPAAVAYHARTAGHGNNLNDYTTFTNQLTKPLRIRFQSYRNHLFTLLKNESWSNFLCDFPWIMLFELKKFFYCLFFDQRVLLAWRDIWHLRQEIWAERQHIHMYARPYHSSR